MLGSGDGVVSTSSLLIGVASSAASRESVLVAGVAGLFAGAMSMAVGEYISVSSQRDAELADVTRESRELESDPVAELEELTRIYEHRGLDRGLAMRVAERLTAVDALGAHLRDELGLEDRSLARPARAAVISMFSAASFAFLPIAAYLLAPASARVAVVAGTSVAVLAALGAAGGLLGGACRWRAALRMTSGGCLAMLVAAGLGRLLGTLMA